MLPMFLMTLDDGERDKLSHLYHAYHMQMLRLARVKLKKGGCANVAIDAEDVVQNAWVRIVKHADAVDLSKNERVVRSYVLTVVSNECARFLRERVLEEPLEENVADESFVKQLELSERYRAVVDAVKRLEDKYSNVLYLYYVTERPIREIAALLGVPEKTVYTRIERGKKKLLEMLGKEGIT